MEKIFKLKQSGTTVRTELTAGLVTFMTMAYILALNPNLMTNFGADGGSQLWNAVFLATCLSSALGTFMMAFLANKPFALAPGMGLNSFFAVVVTNIVSITGMTYLESFRSALVIVFIEGLVFLVLSIFNIREKIVDAIPIGIRLGIAPAIGLMLINLGFGSNVGVYSDDGSVFYVMSDFFGSLTPGLAKSSMGSAYPTMVLSVITIFIGLFIIIVLAYRGIKGAVLLGILASCVVYWIGEAAFLGVNPFSSLSSTSFIPAIGDMAQATFFHLDFSGLLQIGWFTVITLVITFCIIDMFDTIGTLLGAASKADILDEDGNMPQMREALTADSIGTIGGSLMGTSTVTTFAESAAGAEAGGRTGLSAMLVGILFLASMFISPIVAIIPAAATSPALIYVGVSMLTGLKNIKFGELDQLVPVALMLLAIPISGSIGHGIGIAMISYTVLKLFTGRAKEVSILTYVISAIFLVKFFLVA